MAGRSMLSLAAMSRLSWRYLWRNHRRTLIMLLAISVGVWAMIFMTALMRGMVDQMIEDGIDALPGYVQIHHRAYRDDPNVENSLPPPASGLVDALQSPPATAWAPRVKVPAMISSERNSRGVLLLGVDPRAEIALGFDPSSIVEGRFLEGPEDQGLVVGRKMLARLETDLGKRVVIMSQDPDNNIADRGFRIVGVFKGKLSAQEENLVYVALGTSQALLGIGLLLGWLVALYFNLNGFSYPGMEEVAQRYNLPGEMYPSITFGTMMLGPAVVFGFCLLAAIYPALRLFRLRPVDAMQAV